MVQFQALIVWLVTLDMVLSLVGDLVASHFSYVKMGIIIEPKISIPERGVGLETELMIDLPT